VLVGDDWNGVALNRLGFGRSMFGFRLAQPGLRRLD
jgi:hypothetical protein